MRVRIVIGIPVVTLLTPIAAYIGFIGGLLGCIVLGVILYGNPYKFLHAPGIAEWSRTVGSVLCYGAGAACALVLWLSYFSVLLLFRSVEKRH